MKKYTDKQKLAFYRKQNQELLDLIRLNEHDPDYARQRMIEVVRRDDWRRARRKPSKAS